ncbi:hypothetical protein LTR50_001952 [Elasticomyces elasticus]|nr:hypothetical protein LTR50_001952 [Elasticomyces elasticus]
MARLAGTTAIQAAQASTRSNATSRSAAPALPASRPPNTRITRSQSREVSLEPAFSRPTRRQPGGLTVVAENLSLEQAAAVEPVAALSEDAEDAEAAQRRLSPRLSTGSAGALSAFSGTTAKTSFSDGVVAGLDRDILLESLPELERIASKLLDLLAPPGNSSEELELLIKDLAVPNSKASKLCDLREAALDLQRKPFGDHVTPYLRPDIVLRGLLQIHSIEHLGVGLWRPDDIVYKANLATFARQILGYRQGRRDLFEDLAGLEQTFPLILLRRFRATGDGLLTAGSSAFLDKTFHIALSLRTQLAMTDLLVRQTEPDYDPKDIVARIFFDLPTDIAPTAIDMKVLRRARSYKGWDVSGLSNPDGSLPERYVKAVEERVEAFEECFTSDRARVGSSIVRLEAKYSWRAFQLQTMEFIALRRDEIDSSISRAGGVATIMQKLSGEIARRESHPRVTGSDPEEVDSIAQNPGRTPTSALKQAKTVTRTTFDKNALALLKEADRRSSGHVATPAFDLTAAKPDRTLDKPNHPQQLQHEEQWQSIDDIEYDGKGPAPKLTSAERRLAQNRRVERENKENKRAMQVDDAVSKSRSFIDRQTDAKRLEFDESQATQQPVSITSTSSTAKRPLPDEQPDDEEISQDEGYQHDNRQAPAAQRKERTSAAPSLRPVEPSPAPVPTSSPAKRQRRNLDQDWAPSTASQFAEPSAPNGTASYEYAQLNALAKKLSATQKQQRQRHAPDRNQNRQPWSNEETQKLIDLVEEHGVSWKHLKEQDEKGDDVLHRRTPEDLRFKCRNIKSDFLKIQHVNPDFVLPQNFDMVQFGQNMIDALAKFGVRYEQYPIRSGASGA